MHGQGAASPLLYLHLHEHILVLADQDPFLRQMEDASQDVCLHTIALQPKPVETDRKSNELFRSLPDTA